MRAPGAEIDLAFRCPIDGRATIADLASRLDHVAPHRLPHGVTLADWDFTVYLPRSSIDKGVSLSVLPGGALGIAIDTPLYALHGHSRGPGCAVLQDAPSPPACFVHFEHRIPLRLTARVPFDPSILDR